MELTVYVAAYCDRGIDLNDVSFFNQQLACFVAEVADSGLGDCFAGAEVGNGTVEDSQRIVLDLGISIG